MGRFLLLRMNIPNLYPKLLHPVHGNDESAEEYIFDLCFLLGVPLKPLFWFRPDTYTETQIWPMLSADTVTDTKTETTLQRENLFTDIMGYFFHHKRAPKTKFAAKYL